MKTNEIMNMIPALLAGLFSGTIFFAGLWITTKKMLTTKNPAIIALLSFAIRVGVTLISFYLAGAGDYRRLLMCAAGFIISRIAVMRITKTIDNRNITSKATNEA